MTTRLLPKILMLIFFIFQSIISWSQQNAEIQFSTGTYKMPNSTLISKKETDVFEKSKFGKKYYVVIQFTKILSEEEKNSINNQGIELVNYISSNSYSAIINENYDEKNLVKNNTIKAIIKLAPKFKAFPQVIKGDAPQHAIKALGMVDINILTFEKISRTTLELAIAPYKATVLDMQDVFKTYTLRIPKNNVEQLLGEISIDEFLGTPTIS